MHEDELLKASIKLYALRKKKRLLMSLEGKQPITDNELRLASKIALAKNEEE